MNFSLELSGRVTNIQLLHKSAAITCTREHSVICDQNISYVLPFYIPLLVKLPSGEGCKNDEALFSILDALMAKKVDKEHCLIVIGGGALTDLCSFAASILLRGIYLILVPSTLLAMVDAAIGGKTGINYGGYKNMLGSFYPADEVRICPELLSTLPEEEYKSGLAEVIKAGIIADPVLLEILTDNTEAVKKKDLDLLCAEILPRAIKVKTDIVRQDERDNGIRRLLNLGHTFAHALESLMQFSAVRHGDAVAWGIRIATAYAAANGMLEQSTAGYITTLLDRYGYADRYDVTVDALIEAMQRDKKVRNKRVILILPENLGKLAEAEMDEALLRSVLPSYCGGKTA